MLLFLSVFSLLYPFCSLCFPLFPSLFSPVCSWISPLCSLFLQCVCLFLPCVLCFSLVFVFPLEKIYTVTMCFQELFIGIMETPSSWKVVKLVFLRKPDAAPTEGIRSNRAIALTLVMSKWYASCIFLRLEKEKEPEKWKNLHVGGVDGRSCQHLQVMVTNLLQKPWEWQAERNPVMKHGTVVRPTLYLASLDIKTAFDEARPKHVAKIMDNHNTRGWIIAAFLCEMSGLSGMATFECVESSFAFNRCLRHGSVEAPRLWQKMATQMLANVEEEWMKQRKRCSFGY